MHNHSSSPAFHILFGLAPIEWCDGLVLRFPEVGCTYVVVQCNELGMILSQDCLFFLVGPNMAIMPQRLINGSVTRT